ncbi:MAG: glycosyl transferase, group 1 [Candidatus Woesebacteria bacterium GW2011_GWB1_43_14]|uniref:Glycosyl transferase, group 1 n=1 Tax=Candidatus Woesebacteria bacterium GW2011_GWB1_43_14 TaxID=1618578 RepID=A0A0G1DH49_9BACT|nr:MAG: glycosyl transferase, group 1 [Candidatus Woesebacteria bacterium GW2011_GWA1_39_11b]KKS78408.1 MAG: glycosyl transferase, group 1 [Candidatus Woesebacteria bacterium GW2011_GWC1_42_9]KKS97175.1 MAG: glycosyl transferase, group 1 [Candidatus Woesebacteria bacterium GW2011_GWB1_43_14]
MKILLDARLYGLENAGLGRYAINLIRELQRIDKKNDYAVLLRKKYFDELKLGNNWKKILADFRHYSAKEQLLLPKIISNYGPDMAHFLHFNVPIFYRGKFVVTIHDLLMHKEKGKRSTTLPAYAYHIKRAGYKLVFHRAAKRASQIIVPSNDVASEVISYYHLGADKVRVIYEGVDPRISVNRYVAKALTKFSLDRQYFMYAGNVFPHKNIERALEAVSLIKTKEGKTPILLVITKESEFSKRLMSTAIRMRTEEFLKIISQVSDEELGTLMKNSLGFIFPSLSEGFGLPGLEAMSIGTLVLASDIPVFREIYKDNAIYFNPYDFSSIRGSMQTVIDMKEGDRKRRISEGKKFTKRYSWEKTARATLKVYEKTA